MTRNLRILHVISGDLWAGAEVQAFTLISHLARMPETEVAVVVMNEGTLADRLWSIDIGVHVANEIELRPLRILRRLRGVLKSWRPDVVHSHREKENILSTLANRTCGNVPSVRTLHGGNEHVEAHGWRGIRHCTIMWLDRWCWRSSEQSIIAVSKDLAMNVARGYPNGKVVLIENGVDAEVVRAQRGLSDFRTADPGALHVGIAGRLVPVKRVDLFLKAAVHVRQVCTSRRWRFHVFGDGPERSDLQSLADRMGISNVVRFHGHRQDIATCIAGLDVLVICSDHEGMPMIALEAAALEVPTVAHAVGGLIDVIPRDLLVTSHDAEGYSVAIRKAIQEEVRTNFTKHAIEVVHHHSARLNAERVRALYGELIALRNAR